MTFYNSGEGVHGTQNSVEGVEKVLNLKGGVTTFPLVSLNFFNGTALVLDAVILFVRHKC